MSHPHCFGQYLCAVVLLIAELSKVLPKSVDMRAGTHCSVVATCSYTMNMTAPQYLSLQREREGGGRRERGRRHEGVTTNSERVHVCVRGRTFLVGSTHRDGCR